MSNNVASYEPKYTNSWALVIGIDKYKYVSPLGYARNDAEGLARVLRDSLGFPAANVTLLTDRTASRRGIMSAFLKYTQDPHVGPDDRIVVFFAGHGHTVTGRRGETGFLVPVDGQVADLASLVRWDELTRSADLVSAKHILFLMDACYGGLALTRQPVAPGSTRFLKDMLQRYSRQVLTAGKADEVVADAGGPRPGHSMFTGHLLDALEGAAATSEGVLTANAVMAYVYERVGRDPHSRQTPHYGFLDGDGDFIFDTSLLDRLSKEGRTDEDVLVKVAPYASSSASPGESVADAMKGLISTPGQQIRLDDFISNSVRRFLDLTGLEQFPVQGGAAPNKDEFIERLGRYDQFSADLETIVTLLARWAEKDQLPFLEKIFAHIGESEKGSAGYDFWISFGWHPCLLLMYAGGIAALSASRYDALATILTTRVQDRYAGRGQVPIILPVVGEGGKSGEGFKWLPGHERHYSARSEYFFKELQPPLEDLLFLGRRYESLFDRFEMFFALVHCDLRNTDWGPVGRFGWKHSSPISGGSPYNELIAEAEREGDGWAPLKAGLFGGKLERFMEIARAYKQRLDKLGWF